MKKFKFIDDAIDLRKVKLKNEIYHLNNKKFDDIKSVLISSKDYDLRMKRIASLIYNKYKNKNPVFIYVLYGSSKMFIDMFKFFNHDKIFPHIQIYINAKSTSGIKTGKVKLSSEFYDALKILENKDIIIFEDIIETGGTIKAMLDEILKLKIKSVNICSATLKLNKIKKENLIILDYLRYVGFIIPDDWIVGRGLDLNNKYRELKDICVLSDKIISNFK